VGKWNNKNNNNNEEKGDSKKNPRKNLKKTSPELEKMNKRREGNYFSSRREWKELQKKLVRDGSGTSSSGRGGDVSIWQKKWGIFEGILSISLKEFMDRESRSKRQG